jgi:hypothetical protein
VASSVVEEARVVEKKLLPLLAAGANADAAAAVTNRVSRYFIFVPPTTFGLVDSRERANVERGGL